MKVTYKKKFLKDLKDLNSTDVYEKICILVLEEIPNTEDLSTIANLSKLKGDDTAYRIRVGDYRIGFFMEDNEIVMSRVLHRSEIYRYFPYIGNWQTRTVNICGYNLRSLKPIPKIACAQFSHNLEDRD